MIRNDLAAFRRDIHAHPETGFDLTRTPALIADRLEAAGLDVTRGIGQCGVVATLRRGPDDTAIGLRADMDALPITEENGFDYKSTRAGKFHGCGHDGHSTMLLGAALELAQDASLNRTVHFIFQPDEENGNGAKAMVQDGLFDRFPMAGIYGLHNLPGLPVGHFAIQTGPFCAFEDNFEITITGRGGHASMPDAAIDPIVVGSAVVLQLQTIVSRSVSPKEHAVVSVTEFKTDGARNVLASTVTLSGDCRGFDQSVSDLIKLRMVQIVDGVCASYGASGNVDYSTSFSSLVNEDAATNRAVVAASSAGHVDQTFGRVGFSEDFAEYLRHKPGALILMGNGTDGAHGQPLHNPHYDFNDDAIAPGVAFWTTLATLP